MNVRKMMARLNTPGARLGVGGRGGAPELTPQDVAAALGCITDPLSREVFIRVWWPDGAQLSLQALQQAFALKLLAEVRARDQAVSAAKEQLSRAETARRYRAAPTAEDAEAIRAAQRTLAIAQAKVWPWSSEAHQRVLQAALHELCHPNHCTACGGTGEMLQDERIVACPACDGVGIVPVSDRQRARLLGRDLKTYLEGWWQPMYEWTYRLIADAERDGARQAAKLLGDESMPQPAGRSPSAPKGRRRAA